VAKLIKSKIDRKIWPAGISKVLKRLHYPLDVILLSVRWYVAYSLSLRNLGVKVKSGVRGSRRDQAASGC